MDQAARDVKREIGDQPERRRARRRASRPSGRQSSRSLSKRRDRRAAGLFRSEESGSARSGVRGRASLGNGVRPGVEEVGHLQKRPADRQRARRRARLDRVHGHEERLRFLDPSEGGASEDFLLLEEPPAARPREPVGQSHGRGLVRRISAARPRPAERRRRAARSPDRAPAPPPAPSRPADPTSSPTRSSRHPPVVQSARDSLKSAALAPRSPARTSPRRRFPRCGGLAGARTSRRALAGPESRVRGGRETAIPGDVAPQPLSGVVQTSDRLSPQTPGPHRARRRVHAYASPRRGAAACDGFAQPVQVPVSSGCLAETHRAGEPTGFRDTDRAPNLSSAAMASRIASGPPEPMARGCPPEGT